MEGSVATAVATVVAIEEVARKHLDQTRQIK